MTDPSCLCDGHGCEKCLGRPLVIPPLNKSFKYQEVVEAAKNLLNFVRQKFPDDFKPGGKGFMCPYHIALDKAINDLEAKK